MKTPVPTPYEVLEATQHEYDKILHWFVGLISTRPGPFRLTEKEVEFLKIAHRGVDEATQRYYEWKRFCTAVQH